MRNTVLLSLALALLLQGCGLFNSFEGDRQAGAQKETQDGASTPPLLAAPGGVSRSDSYQLFMRPTATTEALTLEGGGYRLEVTDASPAAGANQ